MLGKMKQNQAKNSLEFKSSTKDGKNKNSVTNFENFIHMQCHTVLLVDGFAVIYKYSKQPNFICVL